MQPGCIWLQCESVSLIDFGFKMIRFCFQGDYALCSYKFKYFLETNLNNKDINVKEKKEGKGSFDHFFEINLIVGPGYSHGGTCSRVELNTSQR